MKTSRILSIFMLIVIAVSLVGCSNENFYDTPGLAYKAGKVVDLKINKQIDTVNVSDDVVIWVAKNSKKEFTIAPMTVKDNKYNFNGRETDYTIDKVKRKCADESDWDTYKIGGGKLKLALYRAMHCTVDDVSGYKVIEYKKRHYTLVWKFEK